MSASTPPANLDFGREILTLIATVNRLDGQIQAQFSNIMAGIAAEREARAVMESRFREDLAKSKTEAEARADALQKDVERIASETHQMKIRVWFASGVAAAVLWIASNILPSLITAFIRTPTP